MNGDSASNRRFSNQKNSNPAHAETTPSDGKFPYEDIVNLPRPRIGARPMMAISDRAAQFAPFAALTGHSEAIDETARRVDQKVELDESVIEELNAKLLFLDERPTGPMEVRIVYFVPDSRKSGGAYVEKTGVVKRVRPYERDVVMEDGERIPVADVASIESDAPEWPF